MEYLFEGGLTAEAEPSTAELIESELRAQGLSEADIDNMLGADCDE